MQIGQQLKESGCTEEPPHNNTLPDELNIGTHTKLEATVAEPPEAAVCLDRITQSSRQVDTCSNKSNNKASRRTLPHTPTPYSNIETILYNVITLNFKRCSTVLILLLVLMSIFLNVM